MLPKLTDAPLLHLLVGSAIFAYIGLPLLIMATVRVTKSLRQEPVPAGALPPTVSDYFASLQTPLTQLGFAFIGAYTMFGSSKSPA